MNHFHLNLKVHIYFLCVSDSGQLEKQLEDVTSARRDLEDSSKQIKTLEKQMKGVTQERDELHKVGPLFYGDLCLCNLSRRVSLSLRVLMLSDTVPAVARNLWMPMRSLSLSRKS